MARQRAHSFDTAKQIVNVDAPQQRVKRLARLGYTVDSTSVQGEKLYASVDGEHTIWCERIDGVPMVVIGDASGVAVAYIPAAAAVVFGMDADTFADESEDA